MNYLLKFGLSTEDIEDIREIYNDSLLNLVESIKDNVDNVVKVFIKYNFQNIDEIIKYNLPIFTYTPNYVEKRLNVLMRELGSNYVDIISNNLELLG